MWQGEAKTNKVAVHKRAGDTNDDGRSRDTEEDNAAARKAV